MNFYKIFGGILLLIFGIWLFIYQVRHPSDPERNLNMNLQAYATAFIATVFGIMLLLSEFKKLFP